MGARAIKKTWSGNNSAQILLYFTARWCVYVLSLSVYCKSYYGYISMEKRHTRIRNCKIYLTAPHHLTFTMEPNSKKKTKNSRKVLTPRVHPRVSGLFYILFSPYKFVAARALNPRVKLKSRHFILTTPYTLP